MGLIYQVFLAQRDVTVYSFEPKREWYVGVPRIDAFAMTEIGV
jgi:hypothetical protein